MQPADLLRREGLDARTRHLVLAAVAIWRADWPTLADLVASARAAGLARTDLEETLLQATLFFGFPRVVTAFEHLNGRWPVTPAPAGGGLPVAAQAAAGRALFAAIYGKNDAAVRAMLADCHREFHDFVLEAAYGRILTRPGLEPRTRELLAAGALAAMGQLPQLIAHARGALAFGAGRTEVREALVCATGDEAAADALLRRV